MTVLIGTISFVTGWFLAKTHSAAGKPPSPAEPTSGGGPGPDEPKP